MSIKQPSLNLEATLGPENFVVLSSYRYLNHSEMFRNSLFLNTMLLIQARLLTPILEGEKSEFMDFETPPSLQRRQKFLSQRAS